MKYALLALMLCGCAEARPINEAPASATGIHVTNPGAPIPVIACTWQVFRKRFPQGAPITERETPSYTDMLLGAMSPAPSFPADCRGRFVIVDGHASAWFVCTDPNHPTADELAARDHEIAHAVQAVLGWDASRPLWKRIQNIAPWTMTHPEINARLEELP
jgi:hypothetical protein